MQTTPEIKQKWFERPLLGSLNINWEAVFFTAILLFAVFTRFYDLESRVMSHDESLHTYFSWKLFQGEGYVHDPMMHGPLQFHLVSWSYFLLGDSDFSARVPAVLFGIASIAFLLAFRRYLGRLGVILAAFLLVISPYMLYYARYVRNESFVVFFGLVSMWAVLRYLETGKGRYLLWLTAASALHFSTKETAFIYTAQLLLFLGLLFLNRVTQKTWSNRMYKVAFLVLLLLAAVLLGLAAREVMFAGPADASTAPTVAQPAVPGQASGAEQLLDMPAFLTILPASLGVVALLLALFFLIRDLGTSYLRNERAFGLILLLGTLVLPQLSPIPVRFMGWPVPDTPGAIQTMTLTEVMHFVIFLIPLTLVAVIAGLWWNARRWLVNAALFYGIFIVLYTTNFNNPSGFISGLVGSLGYWMAQQSVQRGSQPWYYYLLIQIPVYEYLAAFGSLTGIVIFIRRRFLRRSNEANRQAGILAELNEPADTDVMAEASLTISSTQSDLPEPQATGNDLLEIENSSEESGETLALYLLIFWTISSLLAYTLAGEKMPWLTVHIALPMILLAGWGFAQVIQGIDWRAWSERRGWLTLLTLVVVVLGLFAAVSALLGMHPPFRSNQLADLQATTRFLSTLVILGLSGFGLVRLAKNWPRGEIFRLALIVLASGGALLTARTAFQAAYINYDQANEFLVYAHSAVGVKDVLARIDDLSRRTTDGMALQFGYDDDTSWPMTWYTRNYYNHRYYGNQPGKDLRELPAIIVGDNNFGKIEPVVGQAFYKFEYIRMVWPNQDYYNLTLQRIWDSIRNPQMRAALFQIWLNRDFTQYGDALGRSISLEQWSPADRMRLYIRKDVAAQLWDYASGPVSAEVIADPYEGGDVVFNADQIVGMPGSAPGQFQGPRGIAVAPDSSLYVADADNNRIQHFSPQGELINSWGTFADATAGDAPGGTFSQPWGVAVGPDGSVYVADTWNHRIQKFSPEGDFQTMWGYFGQAEAPDAFWGPRDVAVDSRGRIFVTDTGNKRIVVFNSDGQFVTQFGEFGLEPGNFDEPVGVDVDSNGRVYVADTWNQRIQVFAESNGEFFVDRVWDIAAWYGQSLDNKPYINVDANGHIFITDPEGARVIEFDETGQFIRYWGSAGAGPTNFGLAAGVAVDGAGGVWVSDAGNQRLMHFTLP